MKASPVSVGTKVRIPEFEDAAGLSWRDTVRSLGERARWIVTPLLLALGVRLGVFCVAGIGARLLAAEPFPGMLRSWDRKDALWYLGVAQHGYYYSASGQSSVNFFPLYPLLIWLVQPVAGLFAGSDSYIAAGLAVSWVAFIGACILLYRLVWDRFDQRIAYIAVLLLGVFPFSLYFGTIYTESPYLLFTLAAFLAADRRRWWLAGLFAALDGATRPPGLMVGACIAVAYLLDWRATRHRLRVDMLALGLIPLGALAYFAYCAWRFHDPLAYAKTSWAGWQGGHLQTGAVSMFVTALAHPGWVLHGDPNTIIYGIYAVLIVAFCLLAIPVWRLLGIPYGLYTLASILLPLATYPTIKSAGRYASVAFPVFVIVALAVRRWPGRRDLLVLVSACLLVIFAVFFTLGRGLP